MRDALKISAKLQQIITGGRGRWSQTDPRYLSVTVSCPAANQYMQCHLANVIHPTRSHWLFTSCWREMGQFTCDACVH